jgi:hypothetical protein
MRYFRPSSWCFALAVCLVTLPAQGWAQAGRPAPPPVPAPPATAADRELAIVNHSKHVVNELYVSPSTADDWGDDKLGDDTLDPGKAFHVKLGRTRDCEFDVQVVYDDASHEETRKVNVCRSRQVAFDGSTAVAAPAANAGNEHPLTVINNDTRPIQQVLISPADAGDWGDDRLSDDSISVGDEKRVPYSGDCVADVRVVFDNRSAEERRGLNLCDSPTLSIEPGWTTADVAPTGPAPRTGQSAAPPPPPPRASTPAPLAMAPPSAPVTPPRSIPAPPPAAPAPGGVTIVNQSGHDVAEFYLFPDGAADHGPDRLGAGEIKAGGTLPLRFDRGTQCRFSARIVYTGHTQDGALSGLDLCHSQQIVLKP